MTFTADDRLRGGEATYERYGAAFYARITRGRPRRARFTPKGLAGTPPGPPLRSLRKEIPLSAERGR